MNEIMTVENVRGYLDEQGTAHLNLEDCARGLGFTETAASGNVTIRWRTVRSYLKSFGYQPVAGSCDDIKVGDYIPENIFYRLAMKANNETAKVFQGTVADKILPSIRKTGMYATPTKVEEIISNPDAFIETLIKGYQRVKGERDAALNQVAVLKPKADYCEQVLQSPNAVPVTVIAKEYGYSAVMFNQLLGSHKIQRRVGGVWTLYQEYVGKGYVVTETVVTKNGGSAMQMKWTQKGRMFLYDFLKARGILPLCEKTMPDLFGGVA